MNKKKLLVVAMVLSMVAVLAIGGTLAYFTDTDEATNTFTVGHIEIAQNETDRNGDAYTETEGGNKLFPLVGSAQTKDENGYADAANYVDKIVTVTVDSDSEPAYVRTFVAVPADLDDGPTEFDANQNILHWNGASANDKSVAADTGYGNDNVWYWTESTDIDWPTDNNGGQWYGYQSTIGGILYNVYVATHSTIVPAGQTTTPNLLGVYLDSGVDFNGTNYLDQNGDVIETELIKNAKVLVKTQAVQAEGFATEYPDDVNVAWTALNEAFGDPTKTDFECPFGGTYTAQFYPVVE